MMLPYYYNLPFPDNREMKKRVRMLHNKVLEIIETRRQQIESGTGMCACFIMGWIVLESDGFHT